MPRPVADATKERNERLDKEWADSLPCASCPIRVACKYTAVIKRVDFPREIFNFNGFSCNIKDNLYAPHEKELNLMDISRVRIPDVSPPEYGLEE